MDKEKFQYFWQKNYKDVLPISYMLRNEIILGQNLVIGFLLQKADYN